MKAAAFDYLRAESVEQTCALLGEAEGESRVIAGGQSLVPMMAMRLARPELLIDIARLEALNGIEDRGDSVLIRACTTQTAALADGTVRRRVPLLSEALAWIGHPQTRNRGTIGGSIAHADPSAEISLVAVTLGAQVSIHGNTSARRVAASEFLVDAMTTVLEADEIVTEVAFPVWSSDHSIGTAFREVSRRRSDFALIAVAAQVAMDEDGICRRLALGIGGVSGVPLTLQVLEDRLVGSRLEPQDLTDAESLTRDGLDPQSDPHATASYRRQVAGTLVRQTLAEASQAARTGAVQ